MLLCVPNPWTMWVIESSENVPLGGKAILMENVKPPTHLMVCQETWKI